MTTLHQLIITAPLSHSDAIADWLEDQALTVAIDLLDDGCANVVATFGEMPYGVGITAYLAIWQQLEPSISYKITPVDEADWLGMVGRSGAGEIGQFQLLEAAAESNRLITQKHIYVEAAGAFGDGFHPTTRGCLLALQWLAQRGSFTNIADIGCGSGVLALSARKLWPKARLIASDLDPRSVVTTRGNRLQNAAHKMRVEFGPGFEPRRVGQQAPYDLILMNILARPLSRLAADARRYLQPGGTLVLSGLLESQIGLVLAAYRAQRLALIRQSVQDGWVTLILKHRA